MNHCVDSSDAPCQGGHSTSLAFTEFPFAATGQGTYWYLSNRWEIEPRVDDANLGTHATAAGKDSILRERALQVTSVYHFTARDNLRFIGQYNSVKRNRDYYAASFSPKKTTQTLSVVYGHLDSLGSNIYFGATTTKSVDALSSSSRRQNELFVKASWAFDLAGLIS